MPCTIAEYWHYYITHPDKHTEPAQNKDLVDTFMKDYALHKTRLLIAGLSSLALYSCDSSTTKSMEVSLETPLSQRQLAVFEESTLRADIVINGGPNQSFIFPPNDDFNIAITGIVLEQTNTISITWTELFNNHPIELSNQTQSFFASGLININAAHQSDQFDYDQDGSSNLEERASGTCVWSAGNACMLDGVLDLPPGEPQAPVVVEEEPTVSGLTSFEEFLNTSNPPPPYEFDFDNSRNILVNGTFDENIEDWYSNSVPNEHHFDGTYCMTLPVGPNPIFESIFAHSPFITLVRGKRYAIQIDAKASRNTVLAAVLVGWPTAHMQKYIVLEQDWKSFTLHYEHTVETDPTRGGLFCHFSINREPAK